MKQMLNTLFVTSEDLYLSLDGEMLWQTAAKKPSRGIRCTRCQEFSAFPMPVPLPH